MKPIPQEIIDRVGDATTVEEIDILTNWCRTLRYPHKYDCIISQLDKNTVREPA